MSNIFFLSLFNKSIECGVLPKRKMTNFCTN